MRIWGSEHEDTRELMNFQKKAKEHSSGCMIVEICEDFRFTTDKIKIMFAGLQKIHDFSDLLQIEDGFPVEFQVLGGEFTKEAYTNDGTVYSKYRKWNLSSVDASKEIFAKNDIDTIMRNSTPIGKEILEAIGL